jgi:uncharacterized protein YhbP (UPF0306 family)
MAKNEPVGPSDQELKKLAVDLIEEQSTMTLATAKGDVAWSAPVYYVFFKSCFYFFSDPTSRHVQESLASGQASSSIYANASTWQEIRGIQMSGQMESLSARLGTLEVIRAYLKKFPLGTLEVIRAYLKKFPFTKDFFKPGQGLDLEAFSKRFKVKLYRFRPTLAYYLDNSIRFGFREKVLL